MLATIKSLGIAGIEPFAVNVEINISRAIPSFDIVGLPDAAVRESRERVRSALMNGGYPYPDGRITVNLAPADIKKAGSLYDLPILVGLLRAQGMLEYDFSTTAFVGELSLSGQVARISGVLPMLLGAQALGITRAFIPYENAAEAAAVQGMDVYAVRDIDELVNFLRGNKALPAASTMRFEQVEAQAGPDFSDVKGQQAAKRALEIAAAGGHNILLIGAPGTGKSMLAKRLPSILPPMTLPESVETTKIYSVCGQLPTGVPLVKTRPFRAPHHSVSIAGLCGGGTVPQPGEISLAHNGVLFLDELPEFSRSALESLRQPLENGALTISRANSRLTYPAGVMLVAAMNPCPCGFLGQPMRKCTCSPAKASAYLGRISGPLLDRIDLHVEVLPVDYDQISSKEAQESSEQIKQRVCTARAVQEKRFAGTGITCNAQIEPSMLADACPLTDAANNMLRMVFDRLSLSGRAYDRILKVARTIADLGGSDAIDVAHISEAVQYRSLDRKYWSHAAGQ